MLMARARYLLLIAALGALATGAAVAATQDSSTTPDGAAPATEPGMSQAAVASVQPNISGHFALFRERPPAAMPDAVAELVASPKRFGRNAALARAIDTVTGTGWVIPGDGFVCIAVPDPVEGYGTACVPTDVAIRKGVSISLWGNLPGGGAAETLLTPDGTTAVTDSDPATVSRASASMEADPGVVSQMTEHPGALHISE